MKPLVRLFLLMNSPLLLNARNALSRNALVVKTENVAAVAAVKDVAEAAAVEMADLEVVANRLILRTTRCFPNLVNNLFF